MTNRMVATRGVVTMTNGFAVLATGTDGVMVLVASFTSYSDALEWVEWRRYVERVNAECNAAAPQQYDSAVQKYLERGTLRPRR